MNSSDCVSFTGVAPGYGGGYPQQYYPGIRPSCVQLNICPESVAAIMDDTVRTLVLEINSLLLYVVTRKEHNLSHKSTVTTEQMIK